MTEIGKNLILVSLLLTSLLALLLLAAKPLRKRYQPRFFLALWLILALRLLIPLTSLGLIQLEVPAPTKNQEAAAPTQAEQTQPETLVEPDAPAVDGATWQMTPAEPTPVSPTDSQDELLTKERTWYAETLVVWVYWCAAAALLFWHLVGWLRFSVYLRSRRKRLRPGGAEQELAVYWTRRMGLRRSIALYRCSALKTPMAVGIFRPAIYLPNAEYNQDELRVILAHEMAHIRKGHLAQKWIFLLAKALHWFNPLVWLLAKRAQQDMELCCDAAVSRYLGEEERTFYGRTILSTLCQSCAQQQYATGYSGGGQAIRERFQVVFGKAGTKSGAVLLALLVLFLALSGCLGFVPAPTLTQEPPQTQVPAPEKEPLPEGSAPFVSEGTGWHLDDAMLEDKTLLEIVVGGEIALASENGFTFSSPTELSSQELYRMFLYLGDYDTFVRDCQDTESGEFLFTKEYISSLLSRYFKEHSLDITQINGYDAARNVVVTMNPSGFGGDRFVNVIEKRVNGNLVTLTLEFFDNIEKQGEPYLCKTYQIELYDGGYYYLSAVVD